MKSTYRGEVFDPSAFGLDDDARFDVIVDETPFSPNQKEATWAALAPFMDRLPPGCRQVGAQILAAARNGGGRDWRCDRGNGPQGSVLDVGMGMKIGLAIGRGAGAPSFSPSSLTTTAWYDPSDLSTMFQTGTRAAPGAAVTADGDPVGLILDKSGNANDLVQATAANRPLYKTSGGQSWLLFDGVNDGLDKTAITFPAACDVFNVFYNSGAKTQMVLLSTSGSTFIECAVSADATVSYGNSGSPNNLVNGVAVSPDTRGGLYTAIGTAGPKVVETQAADFTLWTTGLHAFNYTGFESGGRCYGIIIAPTLSAGNRALVRTYLGAKAGLSI
jgi:hypothetical protein